MVTDGILSVVSTIVAWLIGLLPDWTPPDWLTMIVGFISTTATNLGQTANIIPWHYAGMAFVFVSACWLLAIAIRLGRIVGSFLTVGGGSAG